MPGVLETTLIENDPWDDGNGDDQQDIPADRPQIDYLVVGEQAPTIEVNTENLLRSTQICFHPRPDDSMSLTDDNVEDVFIAIFPNTIIEQWGLIDNGIYCFQIYYNTLDDHSFSTREFTYGEDTYDITYFRDH
jgi:hypothetical protein